MHTRRFVTKDGNYHHIDRAGNHFINNKCVNPTVKSGGEIGDTHPLPEEIL